MDIECFEDKVVKYWKIKFVGSYSTGPTDAPESQHSHFIIGMGAIRTVGMRAFRRIEVNEELSKRVEKSSVGIIDYSEISEEEYEWFNEYTLEQLEEEKKKDERITIHYNFTSLKVS
jgi:hypothetical protein